MESPCDEVDMALFRASTDITIGDSDKCLFWHDRWRPGGALRFQFPDLFVIATRKKRSVKKELHQHNWIRALANISNAVQLAQYVRLWSLMQGVELRQEPDSIRWRWTESGIYSAALMATSW